MRSIGSSFGIVGMPEDEAVDLLDELAAHSTHPKYRYSLKYGVGDVVIWDNASLLHSRDADRSERRADAMANKRSKEPVFARPRRGGSRAHIRATADLTSRGGAAELFTTVSC
jgi:hypothetical protein